MSLLSLSKLRICLADVPYLVYSADQRLLTLETWYGERSRVSFCDLVFLSTSGKCWFVFRSRSIKTCCRHDKFSPQTFELRSAGLTTFSQYQEFLPSGCDALSPVGCELSPCDHRSSLPCVQFQFHILSVCLRSLLLLRFIIVPVPAESSSHDCDVEATRNGFVAERHRSFQHTHTEQFLGRAWKSHASATPAPA